MIDKNLLRTNKPGHQMPWSDDDLLNGLRYFYQLNGRYPTATEIDPFPYLPSSRSIQRAHGGLVALRQRLLPDEANDYTKGEHRSSKAREADARATKYEEEFYNFLIENFMPVAVHEHKIIRPGNVASDFFIYEDEEKGLVIDLFYAQDIRTLTKVVNIKLKRYSTLPFEVYFILVGNSAITNSQIDQRMENRQTKLPTHIKVVTEISFKSSLINAIKNRSRYSL
ncbi:MAG: hypothetical protein ACXWLH_06100 [Candidatus Saccharimonadales bacterium]